MISSSWDWNIWELALFKQISHPGVVSLQVLNQILYVYQESSQSRLHVVSLADKIREGVIFTVFIEMIWPQYF